MLIISAWLINAFNVLTVIEKLTLLKILMQGKTKIKQSTH